MKTKIRCLALVAGIAVLTHPSTVRAKTVDFQDPEQSLQSFIRMRADSSGKDSVTYWKGSVFAILPGAAPKRILGFEGFNVAHVEKQADGSWKMLTREYSVYRDPKSGAILKTWENPYSQQTNTVFDVQNDPVNQSFGQASADGKRYAMPWIVAQNQVQLGFDVPLSYPNPIDPKLYPKFSAGPIYSGSEHFGFFAHKADFNNPKLSSVPVQISWSRTSPWMPWMEMGDKPGSLMFTAWGRKLTSLNELSPDLLAHVKASQPKYLSSPKQFISPNATTWTEFRRLVLEAKPESDSAPKPAPVP